MSHFALFHRFAMQNDERFPIIRKCVIELVKENPTTIFDSNDFTTMDQDILISFFKCHNFSSIKPGILWRNLVEWGVAHTPTVPLKYAEWTDDDFKALGETLEPLIPLINFTDMDTEEFLSEVRPWKKSLDYVDPDFYTQTLEIPHLSFGSVRLVLKEMTYHLEIVGEMSFKDTPLLSLRFCEIKLKVYEFESLKGLISLFVIMICYDCYDCKIFCQGGLA
ncbi:1104_t:CDS:2 [Rhizophagus irregularis]|nr:1104_t:CDS:2 [Rhizophagus irregularis]